MNKNKQKKKILQNAGEKALSGNVYENKQMRNVVEDIDNESEGGSSTLCYEDKLDKNKKDRIR